jgi:hypothetical protein
MLFARFSIYAAIASSALVLFLVSFVITNALEARVLNMLPIGTGVTALWLGLTILTFIICNKSRTFLGAAVSLLFALIVVVQSMVWLTCEDAGIIEKLKWGVANDWAVFALMFGAVGIRSWTLRTMNSHVMEKWQTQGNALNTQLQVQGVVNGLTVFYSFYVAHAVIL